jgi:lysophospholipase L1-like esterase
MFFSAPIFMTRHDSFARGQSKFLQGFLALVLALAVVFGIARAEPPAAAVSPDDLRWEKSIDAFTEADRSLAPPPGGIVFVGSSSIRLWDDLADDFRGPDPIVLNRGFGGARMSDCTRYLERVVIPYKPRLVLVYAGDNDLAEGRQPRDVFDQFVSFAEGIHRILPVTRIAFISIKPSPAREHLIGKMRETNELVLQYTRTAKNLDFIDVFTPMLDSQGHPRGDLFRADLLHLNRTGYSLWKSIIAPHVR